MVKFGQLLQLVGLALKADKAKAGDFAILKADTFGAQANPQVLARLQSVVGYYPTIDLAVLATLPRGSFGYEYARYMRSQALQPITVSPELDAVAWRNVFALRYAITHDIFHVLLGFDTSYAGEMGVLAFAVAQGYSPIQHPAFWIATVLYPLLAPGQFRKIFENRHTGLRLGREAKFLLGYRFEEMWARPLREVKQELGLAISTE